MRDMTGMMRCDDGGIRRRLPWSAVWVSSALVLLAAGAAFPRDDDVGTDESRRARTPLAEIVGAEPPPTVTVVPLDEVPTVQTAFEQARAGIEDGRFQDAVEMLTGALKEPGGDRREVHYLLALAKTRLGRFDEARASAEAAARLGHGDANIHYLLAQIYRGQGQRELAIAHYRSTTLAAERELNNPKVTRAWYSLGQLLERAGYDLAAAQAYGHFDTALWQTHPEQRNAPDFAALLAERPHGMIPRRLELLNRLGLGAEALRIAEWAREIWPDDLSVARSYARALLSAGEAEHAFAFCRERLDAPEAAEALLPIAVAAAREANQLQDWLDTVVSRVAEGRELEQARALTRVLGDVGESEDAVRVGQALLAQRPDDEEITWEVAAARQAAGDPRGALETLITFVRNKPDLAEMPRRRLAQWKGWFETGVNVVELIKALRAEPEADFATDYVLGVSALAADELTLADELLRACVAERPDFAPAYVVRGEMLLASYQWDAAGKYAEKVLKEQPDLVAAHYLLAQAHEGLDENERAEQSYKQAIKLCPRESAYTLALAQHYRRLGNLRGAQRYFQETLTHDPGNGDALEGLIDCYLRGGKIEVARAQLDRLDRDAVPAGTLRRINTLMRFVSKPFGTEHLAELKLQLERYPDDIATARLLAGGLYFRGRLDETWEVIKQVRGTHPDDYHLTMLLVNVQSVRGEFDEAITLLEALIKRFPNRLAVLWPLAHADLNDFRLEEGRALLRRLIELDPDEADRYRVQLLRSYIEFGRCDEAREMVEDWIKAEPDNETLTYHKIAVLLDCDHNDEAFALVKQRLEDDPSDRRRVEFIEYGKQAEHYRQVADRLRKWLEDNPTGAALTEELVNVLLLGDCPDEALEVARKFEGTYAESITRRIWLGRCQTAKGENDTAVAEFNALLDERGVEGDVRREVRKQLVLALHDAERYDEALDRSEQWQREAEGQDQALAHEALKYKRWTLQSAGREDECAQVMELLLEYRPDDVGIFNDLGYTWVDHGINLERATMMIRAAVAAEPWNHAFLDSLGWAYYKAGDFSNARKYLARAVQLRDGRDAVLYDHLADAAYRLGDRDAARKHWKQALSLLEAETSERERTQQADLMAAARAKLAALERGESPTPAPTAAEQNEE